MELTYLCPHCKAAVNAKSNIILAAVKQNDRNSKGLVLLHEKIGNYTVVISSTLQVEKGEIVDFYCPVCHHTLNSIKGENLANFIRIDQAGIENTIVISRVYGEQYTLRIDPARIVTSYGESVSRFVNPEWFL